jgi:hypothetical protein
VRVRSGVMGAIVAALLVLPSAAATAKGGPELRRAEISGPRLDRPLVLRGPRWERDGALLLSQTGLLEGRSHAPGPPDADALGPRYRITYFFHVYGPLPQSDYWGTMRAVVRQRLYPYALGGPWIFTPEGQRLPRTPGHRTSLAVGWRRGSDALDNLLRAWGMPPEPPGAARTTPARTRSTRATWVLEAGIGGGAAACLLLARRARRRLRR